MPTNAHNRLRAARERQHLTQQDVADALGVERSGISWLETAWRGSPRFRARVADHLGETLTVAEAVAKSLR
jgi:transcriptional regulator with XRE-family HTH domain